MEGAHRSLSRDGASRAGSRDLGQLRRLVRYLRPYRLTVGLTLVALVVAASSVLVLGIGIRHLIDGGFTAGRLDAMDHALKAALIVVVVLAVSTFFRSFLVTWLGERVVADLRRDLYRHVVRLSPGFFEVTRTGEVLSRITADASVVQTVVSASLSQALRNLLLLVGGFAMLLVTNPKLTGLVFVVVPLVVVPIVVIGRRVRRLSRLAQDRVGDVAGHAEETLNAVRTVQAFAQEDREATRFGTLVDRSFDAARRRALARALLGAVVITLVFGAIVVVLWVGGRDVLAGRITGGELAAFVFYAVVTASATGALSEIMGDLQRAAGAAERLFELLETPAEIEAPSDPTPLPARLRGTLALSGVRFAYPARPDHPVLHGIDLEVRPGETVALVGPSGAGKSSVFQLLMRFYDPTAGSVRLDGIDLRELAPEALRARVGLVPQEPVIFSADAFENIR
ncbi:MAG TPA: ABC transporter transmembrane domain-containing protein, partial [Geminicoccaceae bacterium]